MTNLSESATRTLDAARDLGPKIRAAAEDRTGTAAATASRRKDAARWRVSNGNASGVGWPGTGLSFTAPSD